MALTHTRNITYTTNAGTIANTSESFSGDGEIAYDGTIAAAETDGEIDLAIVRSTVRTLCIYASVAMTIKTNSSSAPTDTFTLAANTQIVWDTNDARVIPFTADVTKLFVTNAGASAGTLKIRVLYDMTPVLADPA